MKRFCRVLAIIFCILISSSFSKAEEVSNTLSATINGEDVIAYLDQSSVTYFSGSADDIDASFVSFDAQGQPKYPSYIYTIRQLL